MKNNAEQVRKLENWERIGDKWDGIYRFQIAHNLIYHIEIEFYTFDTPIETAVASCYEVRVFNVIVGDKFIERTTLAKSVSVRECLDAVYEEIIRREN